MLAGKIYVKKQNSSKKDYFDEALEDYFSHTINLNTMPDEEDLEKMKITLNWLIKNRSSVSSFYLKDYKVKDELYKNMSKHKAQYHNSEQTFDIKNFVKDKIEEYTGVESF